MGSYAFNQATPYAVALFLGWAAGPSSQLLAESMEDRFAAVTGARSSSLVSAVVAEDIACGDSAHAPLRCASQVFCLQRSVPVPTRPIDPVLSGPAAGTAALEAMLRAAPCALLPESDLWGRFRTAPEEQRLRYSLHKMGGRDRTAETRLRLIQPAGTAPWEVERGVSGMAPHFRGAIGNASREGWLFGAYTPERIALNIRDQRIQVLGTGNWAARDWRFGLIKVRYFERQGGRYVNPVGYRKIAASEEPALVVNDPAEGGRIFYTSPGKLGFKSQCGCDMRGQRSSCKCVSQFAPGLPQHPVSYLEHSGDDFVLMESHTEIGVPHHE